MGLSPAFSSAGIISFVRFAQHDALPPAFDQAALLPA
jgi:hypothetical protein